MPDYKAMYLSLFNAVTDVIEILKAAQQESEDTYNEILDSDTDSDKRSAPG